MKLQKLGGYASIILACINVIANLILLPTVQEFSGLGDLYDPTKMMAAYQAAPISFCATYIMGIMVGILILVLFLALEERMKDKATYLMRLSMIAASAFAVMYITTMIGGFFRNMLITGMNDPSAFRVFLVLHEFLGSAAFHMLGWGLLMIGWAALKTHRLPQALGYITLLCGIVLIITFAFAISASRIGMTIQGLLALVTLLWLGIALLKNPEPDLK